MPDEYHTLTENSRETRDLLIELVGVSGKNGRIGMLEKSRDKLGIRIGQIERDLAQLKQTRAQLYVIAAIAIACLGAIIQLLFTR